MSAAIEGHDLKRYYEVKGEGFFAQPSILKAVDGASFSLESGKTLAIVGESGCGKSVTVQALMGLVPMPPGRIVSGSARLLGQDLIGLSQAELNEVRGADMGMIFQDPMTFLNPVIKIGTQISEVYVTHEGSDKKLAEKMTIEALEAVGMPSPEKVYDYYPHQMSGGMQQRALIAMAIASKPDLIIAPNFVALQHIMFNLYARKMGVPMIGFTDSKIRGINLFINSYKEDRGLFFERLKELENGADSKNFKKAELYSINGTLLLKSTEKEINLGNFKPELYYLKIFDSQDNFTIKKLSIIK